MTNEFLNLKIYKMGAKLGLFFNKSIMKKVSLHKGDYIKIHLDYNGKEDTFLSKFNYIITLRTFLIKRLGIKEETMIKIKIEKINFLKRSDSLFRNNKLDLLFLIPLKNRLGFDILIYEFLKNNESWLRVWYCFNRGSCKEIEIKRYVDISRFGKFLGLMQSEGTKKNIDVVEFCNKSIFEHLDFLEYLEEIGISKNEITGKFDYHPKIKEIEKIINDFEIKTKIKIRCIAPGPTSGGGYGFKLIFRSRLFAEIISNSLNFIRKLIKEESDIYQKKLY